MGEGSGAVSFSNTPKALAARGHEVHIIHPAEPGEPGGEETLHGVRFHRFETRESFIPRLGPLPLRLARRVGRYLAYQRIGTRTALQLARKIRPDLVIGYGHFEAPVAHRVAQRIGVPNVTRLFGNVLSINLDDPIRFRMNFPQVLGFKAPCARLILTNDGASGVEVARRCGVPLERLVHLRNGLDFGLFQPGPPDPEVFDQLGLPQGTPILMTVTRLATEKKLERIINAMPALLQRVPNAAAVLVGEGHERAMLEERAARLGVASSIHLPGAVAYQDLPRWHRSASIVLSLLDRTNASNPVFEAMACQRCVVVLDAGTTREVVVPDQTGVLLDKADLPRLGNMLADLISDEDRRKRLGTAARTHIRSLLLDPQDRMRQELDILLQVIDESKRKDRN
jgi:glycosyltransferase involved in cell wall biosynthesis